MDINHRIRMLEERPSPQLRGQVGRGEPTGLAGSGEREAGLGKWGILNLSIFILLIKHFQIM